MKITFYIPKTQAWNRALAFTLAREQARAGYEVRILEAHYTSAVAEDGIRQVQSPYFRMNAWARTAWNLAFFIFHRRGIVHIMGAQSGAVIATLRVLHPFSRIVLHVDDLAQIPPTWRAQLSRAIAIRFAHVCITSQKDILRHEALARVEAEYIPYAMHASGQIIDPSVLRAHGLELQQFFLAYAMPSRWQELQTLIKDWRESVRPLMPHAKLAIVFTEDIPSQHIVFGHDIVVLGHINGYVEQMIQAGARAILTPTLSAYRLQLLSAMSLGKYAVPLRELIVRNPFALETLEELYRSGDHDIADLKDAALTMSWGHIARAIITEEHQPEQIAMRYEDLYERLLFTQKATANARMS